MEKSKKFRMPSGIRNKLMAAIAMLLVSSIMMVSSTYAWFTLSTAPEVTGITTSVGANGNLEMALLNSETFNDMSKITSAVNDSVAFTGDVTRANITWGNLVDLSDISYGLNLIALNPAAPNYAVTGEGASAGINYNQISLDNLLQTAVYGSDGRVAELDANTVAGVYDSTSGKWVLTQEIPAENNTTQIVAAHGVRAIGVDSNMTTAQLVLNAAKSAFNSSKNTASGAVSSAVGENQGTFLLLATGATTEYGEKDVAALRAVAVGVQSSLKTIVKAYSNAILAALATVEDIEDETLTLARTTLANNTSAANLETTIADATGLSGNETVAKITARVSALKEAQSKVDAVITACDNYTSATTADTIKNDIVVPLIGNSSTVYAYDADGESIEVSGKDLSALTAVAEVYVGGGLLAEVAKDAGIYKVAESLGAEVFAAEVTETVEGENTVVTIERTGNLAEIATSVTQMEAGNTENAEQTIADFYGYIIDFAFRTNAAGSNLQLQTAAANRVYSEAEGDNLATQGSGSTATFAFDSTVLTEAQVRTLLGAVRLMFLNPTTGVVHKTAALTDIDVNGGEATAKVKLTNQEGDVGTIVGLNQNVATAVSVMVYLDGTVVDNSAVANAASSGMLNLNLQFSSDATLIPMANSALENMTITYEELETPEYLAGLYTFNGGLYTVNVDENYKIYNGSNSMVYFSNDEATYTRLTVMNYGTVLTPVEVNVEASKALEEGGTADLTVSIDNPNATITSVAWESGDENVVTVADADATDAVVTLTGEGAGTATLTGTIGLEFTYTDANSVQQTVEKTVVVKHDVTVNETAAPEIPADPDAGEDNGDDEGNEPAAPTAMTAVTCADATVTDASFTGQVISFKLTGADSAAITSGTVTVTTAAGTVDAAYANDVWSATVTDTLAANTAVTVAYTA